MKQYKITMIILGFLSGILMSIPYLVPHTGVLALVGLVPLLAMERIGSEMGTRHFCLWHYLTFVLWNAITTFWVCNATVGGGIFAILANSLQMSLVFGLFRQSKKYFKGSMPYIFLAAAWIAWEKWYLDYADISWPWLVLGNSFAGSIRSIQWYEFTGTLGGSLWIWICNLSIFGLMVSLSDGSWQMTWNKKAKTAAITGTVLLFTLPFAISGIIWHNYDEEEDPVEVFITQPNIDPYHKFQSLSQGEQDAIVTDIIHSELEDRYCPVGDSLASAKASNEPILILAPETFTSYMQCDQIYKNHTWDHFVTLLKDYPGVNMLFGASTYERIESRTAPSPVARNIGKDLWIKSHNSALCIDGTGRTDLFHKNKLVVGVEMTPYPKLFTKIDDLLGGVIGRCEGQGDVTLMNLTTYDQDRHIAGKIPFGSAICYESVYGNYYREYSLKGAEFMTIITNDAWWGDTPGYMQHLRYASLRAIESRRSIARCANTGISALINQKGQILEKTQWWEKDSLRGKINKNDKMTFFTTQGDMVGRVCVLIFILFAVGLVSHIFRRGRN